MFRAQAIVALLTVLFCHSIWANQCQFLFAGSRVIQEPEFFRLLQDPQFSLNTRLNFKEKMQNKGLSIESPIYSKVKELISDLNQTKDFTQEEMQSWIMDYFKMTSLTKAQRLLLMLDKDLNYPQHKLNLTLKSISFDPINKKMTNLIPARRTNESLQDYILSNNWEIFNSYRSSSNEKLISSVLQPSRVIKNIMPELDSAHALDVEITAFSIIIKGFIRADTTQSILKGHYSTHQKYHLIRFVNQLLRLKSVVIPGAEDIALFPLIRVKDGRGGFEDINLETFKTRYEKTLFDDGSKGNIKKLTAKIKKVFLEDFFTLLAPSDGQVLRKRRRGFTLLEPERLRVLESDLKTEFIEEIKGKVLLSEESPELLLTLLEKFTFNFDTLEYIPSVYLNSYVRPSYKLEKLNKVKSKSKTKTAEFLSESDRDLLISETKGSLSELMKIHLNLKPTKSINTRLKNIINLIPNSFSQTILIHYLEKKPGLMGISLNEVKKDPRHIQDVYKVILEIFLNLNKNITYYNENLTPKQKPIKLVNLESLMTANGLNSAFSTLTRFNIPLAKNLNKLSEKSSRLNEIEALNATYKKHQKQLIKKIPILEESHLAYIQKTTIPRLSKLAKILKVSFYVSGGTAHLINKLVQYLNKATTSKNIEAYEQLKSDIAFLGIGAMDSHNAKLTKTKRATYRIYSALYLIATYVNKYIPNGSVIQPESIYLTKEIDQLIDIIPGLSLKNK